MEPTPRHFRSENVETLGRCPSKILSVALERGMVVLELAKTMLPDASTPPTRATEHMGTQRDINKQLIHTTHRLHSQCRFGAISRISAIATPALHAQAAQDRAAHTMARTPACAHRGSPESPPGSHLAARIPHSAAWWPPAAREEHAQDRDMPRSNGCSVGSHRLRCLPYDVGG